MTYDDLIVLAFEYLELNPERFNDQEKMKFMQGLQDWMQGKSETIDDEVYDFLIEAKLSDQKSREESFASFLNDKYGHLSFKRILDVGAGRMCKLSSLIAKNGARMFAMDPNIRLSKEEALDLGIAGISHEKFSCDAYPQYGRKGTDVRPFHQIVALEPCEATEHIIRQGLKQDRQFDIVLCAAPHDALSGKKFGHYSDWYDYLLKISGEVDISQYGDSYIASNDPQKVKELER